jgi:hypothetical protein
MALSIRAHCAHFFVHDNTELRIKRQKGVKKSPYFNWEGLSGKVRGGVIIGCNPTITFTKNKHAQSPKSVKTQPKRTLLPFKWIHVVLQATT